LRTARTLQLLPYRQFPSRSPCRKRRLTGALTSAVKAERFITAPAFRRTDLQCKLCSSSGSGESQSCARSCECEGLKIGRIRNAYAYRHFFPLRHDGFAEAKMTGRIGRAFDSEQPYGLGSQRSRAGTPAPERQAASCSQEPVRIWVRRVRSSNFGTGVLRDLFSQ
jgi:hypothetical protein